MTSTRCSNNEQWAQEMSINVSGAPGKFFFSFFSLLTNFLQILTRCTTCVQPRKRLLVGWIMGGTMTTMKGEASQENQHDQPHPLY